MKSASLRVPLNSILGSISLSFIIRLTYLRFYDWEAISVKEHLMIICFGGKKIARDKVLIVIILAIHLQLGITL